MELSAHTWRFEFIHLDEGPNQQIDIIVIYWSNGISTATVEWIMCLPVI